MTSTRTEPDPPVTARRRRRWPWILGAVLLVIALVATPFVYSYRRQIWSYATHRKGSPTHTVAYRHLPTPDLHMAVAGDIGDSGIRLDAQRDGRWHASIASRHTRPSSSSATTPTRTATRGTLPGTVFQPFAEVLDHAELLAILGNHDVKKGHAKAQTRILGMPGRLVVAHDRRHAPRRTSTPTSNRQPRAATHSSRRTLGAGPTATVEGRGTAPSAVLRRIPGFEHRALRGVLSAPRSSATASSWCSRATTTTTNAASGSAA